MTSAKKSIVRRLSDGLLVVLSILVAFGIDAAWDESNEARDLREDLVNVGLELEANRARVQFHLDLAQRIYAAIGVIAGQMEPHRTVVTAPDTTAWLARTNVTLDASLGAIDALLASGRMGAVDDLDLARRLAGLRDRIEDAVEDQVEAKELDALHAIPLLLESDNVEVSLVAIERTQHISDAMWSAPRVAARSLEYRGEVRVPSSQGLRQLYVWRQGLVFVTIGELRALLEEFDLVESLIQRELGR